MSQSAVQLSVQLIVLNASSSERMRFASVNGFDMIANLSELQNKITWSFASRKSATETQPLYFG